MSLPVVFFSLSVVVLPLIEPLVRIFLPLRSWMLLLSLTFDVTRTLFLGSHVIVVLTLRVRSRRIADLILAGTFGEYVYTSGPSFLTALE